MTAQIINFAERREAIRDRRNEFHAEGFLLPGVIVACGMFWFFVGIAVVRAWPLVRLP